MSFPKLSVRPRAFVDVETTGLDPIENEMLEFAALKGDEILNFKIKPRRMHTAHPKALEVNGYKEENWGDALDIAEAAPKIAAFLKDAVIVGHNVRFDMDFISQFLKEAGVNVRLDYHLVDTVTIAYIKLVPLGLDSLSLKNVCQFVGIQPEPEVHRALAGAKTCKAIYENLTGQVG